MPETFTHPFSGAEASTCSVATKYIADNAGKLNLTEAGLEGMTKQGGWDVIKAKIDAGTLKDGEALGVIQTKIALYRLRYSDSKIEMKKIRDLEDTGFPALDKAIDPFYFEGLYIKGDKATIQWAGTKHPKPIVSPGSTAKGALPDIDAAKMFVEVKDELAKKYGVNIKGANPKLDAEVYQALAKKAGYTAEQMKAKVDRYKAAGNKLSALKKKTLKSKPTEKPPTITVPKLEVDAGKPKVVEQKATPPTPSVPTQANTQTVKAVVDDIDDKFVDPPMALEITYSDKDIAKKYIIAKDKIVAESSGKWTLYSKGDDFDNAIYKMMRESFPNASNATIKTQVARYISEQGKLSALKKEMIKKGELKAEAPTLKGKKATKPDAVPPTPDLSAALQESLKPKLDTYKFDDAVQDVIFSNKGSIYLSSPPEVVYDKLLELAGKYAKQGFPIRPNDTLSIARALDAGGARKAKVPNGHLYEKKLQEWVESGKGKDYILNKAKAEEVRKAADKVDLPEDSALFREISPEGMNGLSWASPRDLPSEVRSAITKYTGSYYHDMNTALRSGGTRTPTIENAERGMKVFEDNLLLHRGTDLQQFGVTNINDIYSLVGKTVQDKGFISTSVGNRAAFSGQLKMEIEAPKGVARGIWAKPISQFSNENELILAPGTKFKILKVFKHTDSFGGTQTIVRVRVVP